MTRYIYLVFLIMLFSSCVRENPQDIRNTKTYFINDSGKTKTILYYGDSPEKVSQLLGAKIQSEADGLKKIYSTSYFLNHEMQVCYYFRKDLLIWITLYSHVDHLQFTQITNQADKYFTSIYGEHEKGNSNFELGGFGGAYTWTLDTGINIQMGWPFEEATNNFWIQYTDLKMRSYMQQIFL